MGKDLVLPIITLLLGGGLASAILNVVRAKNESKKAPVERDAVIVTSAESAVVIMQKVLDATNQQLARKEIELNEVTGKLLRVKEELAELKQRCGELEDLLGVITSEHEHARHKHDSEGRASG